MEQLSDLLIQKLESMAEDSDSKRVILSKRKAISALFPYAISLARGGDQTMTDAVFRAVKASRSHRVVWHRVRPYTDNLLDKPIPHSLDRFAVLFSPYVLWGRKLDPANQVSRWADAALATPYTEEVGQSIVEALLNIVSAHHLRPYIPRDAWELLKKRPSLPPYDLRRELVIGDTVRHIRGLGDIEVLKSYFLIIWSERARHISSSRQEVLASIKEDFGKAETRHHRGDLVRRLDYVLEELGREWELIEQGVATYNGPIALLYQKYPIPICRMLTRIHVRTAKSDYERFREALLRGVEVEGEATNTVTGASPKPIRQRNGLEFFLHVLFTVFRRLSNALQAKIFACILS